jgi:hypothetical protein
MSDVVESFSKKHSKMDRAEEHMTPDKMKLIAKRLFIAGFFFLPFLWLVNAFFFRTVETRVFVVASFLLIPSSSS